MDRSQLESVKEQADLYREEAARRLGVILNNRPAEDADDSVRVAWAKRHNEAVKAAQKSAESYKFFVQIATPKLTPAPKDYPDDCIIDASELLSIKQVEDKVRRVEAYWNRCNFHEQEERVERWVQELPSVVRNASKTTLEYFSKFVTKNYPYAKARKKFINKLAGIKDRFAQCRFYLELQPKPGQSAFDFLLEHQEAYEATIVNGIPLMPQFHAVRKLQPLKPQLLAAVAADKGARKVTDFQSFRDLVKEVERQSDALGLADAPAPQQPARTPKKVKQEAITEKERRPTKNGGENCHRCGKANHQAATCRSEFDAVGRLIHGKPPGLGTDPLPTTFGRGCRHCGDKNHASHFKGCQAPRKHNVNGRETPNRGDYRHVRSHGRNQEQPFSPSSGHPQGQDRRRDQQQRAAAPVRQPGVRGLSYPSFAGKRKRPLLFSDDDDGPGVECGPDDGDAQQQLQRTHGHEEEYGCTLCGKSGHELQHCEFNLRAEPCLLCK
jgi:hypothetical protein